MALFMIKDLASGGVKLVRAESEANAREVAAGTGKSRDERYLSQDHVGCDELDAAGRAKVLLDLPASSAAVVEAGGKKG